MAMKMKYIIVNMAFTELSPIVFREDVYHESVVPYNNQKVVDSAGFVSIHTSNIGEVVATAYGYSTGLKLGAKVERDSEILTRFFNGE